VLLDPVHYPLDNGRVTFAHSLPPRSPDCSRTK
jgi:hypothetical protein